MSRLSRMDVPRIIFFPCPYCNHDLWEEKRVDRRERRRNHMVMVKYTCCCCNHPIQVFYHGCWDYLRASHVVLDRRFIPQTLDGLFITPKETE